MKILIELKNIDVVFKQQNKDFYAVKDVSLNINKGEVFGIVGPSGAGKSTLVRTINLLQHPTNGKVLIEGQNITNLNRKELSKVRLNIGMIFQHFNLISGATIAGNIAFALEANHYPKSKIQKRVQELLELVHLPEKADAYPANLSGGQKQRVAIARALANDPKILLCDEATSALDLENTEEIVSLLKEIKNKLHITIVFITHEMEVAKKLFDRIAFMENGELKEVANIYDAFSNPKVPIAKNLVERVINVTLPEQVCAKEDEEIYRLKYTGEKAYSPIISEVSKKFEVSVDIINAKIDYIQGNPLGILIIAIAGEKNQRTAAYEYMKEHVFEIEKLAGGER
ncbi:MAG: methionine ABC transporter ATP-binding protein [Anaerostipes sp.]